MSLFVSNLIQATAAPTTGEPTPATSWQWKRSGADISGATESSYTATVADTGQDISVVQTVTNVVGVASASSTALGPVLPFTPLVLFAGGAQGTWYDPADTATLFQDSAGTTPVTAVEQPVGLMLDKSQGLVLGPELVTNGTFDTNVTGWSSGYSATITWSVGSMLVTNGANDPSRATTPIATVVGKSYQLIGAINAGSNSAAFFAVSNAGNGGGEFAKTTLGPGAKTSIFTATATTTYVVAATGVLTSGANATFDNISVKELPGNHAFQTTSASRPVLSARYNLLTKTEQFDDAVWTKTNTTVTANTTATTDPLGGNTADKIVENSASGIHAVRQGNLTTVATNYTFSAYLKAAERTWVLFNADTVGGASGYAEVYVDLTNGTFGTQAAGNGYTIVSKSITSAGNGWWLVSLTYTATSNAGAGVQIFLATGNGTNSYTGNGTSGIYTWGAQLVATNSLTSNAYQRVNTSTDYATTGFLPYLKFDGVDDSLSTNSISFTSTDKMSVFAGVRKLSDAATAILCELSINAGPNDGTFFVAAPVSASANYQFTSKGTVLQSAAYTNAAVAAPITNTLTGLGDISGDRATLRINGAQLAQSTSDQGTGNYGNYPLYIGRRGNSSLPFNGQLYSMVIVGKAVTAGELKSTEDYIAEQTGVTIA